LEVRPGQAPSLFISLLPKDPPSVRWQPLYA
jgi:hypothetical protein